MKRSKWRSVLRLSLGVLGALTLAACVQLIRNSGDEPVPARSPDTLRLATYNVHYIILSKETGPWSLGDWERRKEPLNLAFKALDADVVGFQEMESFQRGSDGSANLTLDWLLAQNPGYAAAAVGEWREFPSTQPILYQTEGLTLRDQGWFFFSETPDVIYSRTFNGSYPAFASWASFTRSNGSDFRVINVHFEYSSGSNRRLSAELVVERIAPWIAAGETVFLIGDLNARLGSRTHRILEAAGLRFSPVDGATYHLNRGLNLFGAIDHIGATHGATSVGAPVVIRDRFAGEWPTDHYPVLADFELP